MRSVALSDICEIVQGGRLKLTGDDFVSVGYPAYGAGGMNGQLPNYEFDREAVVLSSIGARCGKCFLASGKWTSLANTQLILPDSGKVDVRFLWYQLNDEERWPRSGSAQPFIKPSDVKRHLIALPPLDEQRRIAAILDQADALRRANVEALNAARRLEENLFADLLSQKGAKSRPLNDVFWIQEGPGIRNWQFRDQGIKLLNVANIKRNGTLDLSSTSRHLDASEVAERYSHFLVDPGDLVVASSGIGFDDDGLLRTRGAFVSASDLPLCMNTSTIRFKNRDVSPGLHFLREWLQSREFRTQITQLVTGSAQQNFGPTHLKKLTFTVPDRANLEAYGPRGERARSISTVLRKRGVELDTLFASLQHRAFSGELTRSAERELEAV